MSNYLKKILFTLLILTVPYMNSVSKAFFIPTAEDEEAMMSRTVAPVVALTRDQQEDPSVIKQHSMNLEDSKVSWISYMPSLVKSAAQNAYNILDYTTRNPQKTAIIGLFTACQITSVAADWYGVWCCANNTSIKEFCGSVPVTASVYNCWEGITDLSPKGYGTLNNCISGCGRSSPFPFRCKVGTTLSLVRVDNPFFCVPE
jgi:hypothetical protein